MSNDTTAKIEGIVAAMVAHARAWAALKAAKEDGSPVQVAVAEEAWRKAWLGDASVPSEYLSRTGTHPGPNDVGSK